jgi:chromate reductase
MVGSRSSSGEFMSTSFKVGVFVGSLSSKSINRLLAKALANLSPPELS